LAVLCKHSVAAGEKIGIEPATWRPRAVQRRDRLALSQPRVP
jgi:hypothetical protein